MELVKGPRGSRDTTGKGGTLSFVKRLSGVTVLCECVCLVFILKGTLRSRGGARGREKNRKDLKFTKSKESILRGGMKTFLFRLAVTISRKKAEEGGKDQWLGGP